MTSDVRIPRLVKPPAKSADEKHHQTFNSALQGTEQKPFTRTKPCAERDICVLKVFSSVKTLALLKSASKL